jgi:hypothetical protein
MSGKGAFISELSVIASVLLLLAAVFFPSALALLVPPLAFMILGRWFFERTPKFVVTDYAFAAFVFVTLVSALLGMSFSTSVRPTLIVLCGAMMYFATRNVTEEQAIGLQAVIHVLALIMAAIAISNFLFGFNKWSHLGFHDFLAFKTFVPLFLGTTTHYRAALVVLLLFLSLAPPFSRFAQISKLCSWLAWFHSHDQSIGA